MSGLTDEQIEALRWIAEKPHDHSSRLWNDDFRLEGPDGHIVIPAADHLAIMHLVEPTRGPNWGRKHFSPNAAGRKVLKAAGRQALSEAKGEG